MKKLLITTLSFMTLFTVFGDNYASASNNNKKEDNKKQVIKYIIKDSRGVRTGSYRETYQGGTVRKVETYDTRGVRRTVVKAGK